MFVVDEAEVRQVFWGIHESVGYGAAMYFAELASTLRPRGRRPTGAAAASAQQPYLLSEGRRAPRLKAVYELRAMTLAGFMPTWWPARIV